MSCERMKFEEFMEKYGLIYEMYRCVVMLPSVPTYGEPLHEDQHIVYVNIYSLTMESNTVGVIVKSRRELYEIFLLCHKILQTLNGFVTDEIQIAWNKCEEHKWVDT